MKLVQLATLLVDMDESWRWRLIAEFLEEYLWELAGERDPSLPDVVAWVRGSEIEPRTVSEASTLQLSTHLADPDLMRADDFRAFFDARRHALLDQVASAMGKEIEEQGVVEPESTDTFDANDDTDDL